MIKKTALKTTQGMFSSCCTKEINISTKTNNEVKETFVISVRSKKNSAEIIQVAEMLEYILISLDVAEIELISDGEFLSTSTTLSVFRNWCENQKIFIPLQKSEQHQRRIIENLTNSMNEYGIYDFSVMKKHLTKKLIDLITTNF